MLQAIAHSCHAMPREGKQLRQSACHDHQRRCRCARMTPTGITCRYTSRKSRAGGGPAQMACGRCRWGYCTGGTAVSPSNRWVCHMVVLSCCGVLWWSRCRVQWGRSCCRVHQLTADSCRSHIRRCSKSTRSGASAWLGECAAARLDKEEAAYAAVGSRCQHRHCPCLVVWLVVWQRAAWAAGGLPLGVAHRAAVKRLSKRDVDSSNECLTRPCAIAAHTRALICMRRQSQGVVAQGRTLAVPAASGQHSRSRAPNCSILVTAVARGTCRSGTVQGRSSLRTRGEDPSACRLARKDGGVVSVAGGVGAAERVRGGEVVIPSVDARVVLVQARHAAPRDPHR